jgi:hypothetical protein
METINNLFDQEITKTLDAYPSIYTKDDVVSLLSKLRTVVLTETAEALSNANATPITEMDFQNFSESVTRELENRINRGDVDVHDYSSAEFSINYHNTIEIESIDFNSDAVTDELSDILLDKFQESFGKLITDTEENDD